MCLRIVRKVCDFKISLVPTRNEHSEMLKIPSILYDINQNLIYIIKYLVYVFKKYCYRLFQKHILCKNRNGTFYLYNCILHQRV
jgi:hypothetical protein